MATQMPRMNSRNMMTEYMFSVKVYSFLASITLLNTLRYCPLKTDDSLTFCFLFRPHARMINIRSHDSVLLFSSRAISIDPSPPCYFVVPDTSTSSLFTIVGLCLKSFHSLYLETLGSWPTAS